MTKKQGQSFEDSESDFEGDSNSESEEQFSEIESTEQEASENTDEEHSSVSNEDSEGNEDSESGYYEEEAQESATEDKDLEIESVPGYDKSFLNQTRESLQDEIGDENLLDAWYAEFGDSVNAVRRQPTQNESVQEVVIGKDDRRKVTATTKYPWRTICSLLITAKDGSRWIGTGWLVGNRTVITAGHVVYMHSRGGWAKRIEVIPGRNGGSRPYGSCFSSSLRSVKGWTNKKKRSRDYGAIILPKNCPYGKRLGYFGYANYSISKLLGKTANLAGYPGDKPTGTMWYHARKIKFVTSRTLVYNIDSAGGQSGSPVWRYINGKRYAVGIHTNGHSSGNSATRIVRAVFNNIKKWKQQGS